MREYRVHMIKANQYDEYMCGCMNFFNFMDIIVKAKDEENAMDIADEVNKGWFSLGAKEE